MQEIGEASVSSLAHVDSSSGVSASKVDKLTSRKDRVRTAPLGLRGLARGSAASHLDRARRNRQDNSVNFVDDFRYCLIKLTS